MNLSQEEIEAMLAGGAAEPAPEEAGEDSILSEFNEAMTAEEEAPAKAASLTELTDMGGLTDVEIDTLGEVGNMCMGAMATTLYALLDRRVEITTPRVSVIATRDIISMYKVPFVIVEVEYTQGIGGKNLLLLKEEDAAMITDLLMGGEGVVEEPIELGELHMSAINEIMNQMIGASATALSKVIGTAVDISTPVSQRMTLESDNSGVLESNDTVILINFDMEIENLLKSQLVQLMPYDQGREMSATLVRINEQDAEAAAAAPPPAPAPQASEAPPPAPAQPAYSEPQAMPVQPAFAPPPYQNPADAAAFTPFPMTTTAPSTLNRVYDIPLRVSVELGKTKKEISEILDFDMGTVVVLDKMAGDSVDVIVNGKLVASGEVVVIDDNYGVRITQIYSNNIKL